MTGVFQRPDSAAGASEPTSHHNWEEEEDFYYQAQKESSRSGSAPRRIRTRMAAEETTQTTPDDMTQVRSTLLKLRNVVLLRCLALLLLTVFGGLLAKMPQAVFSPLFPVTSACAAMPFCSWQWVLPAVRLLFLRCGADCGIFCVCTLTATAWQCFLCFRRLPAQCWR